FGFGSCLKAEPDSIRFWISSIVAMTSTPLFLCTQNYPLRPALSTTTRRNYGGDCLPQMFRMVKST
ncbi:MAG: hypothetical protein ACRCXB_16945, partial [Aeromonadaceae bacterium]